MAITCNDELSKIIGIETVSDRVTNLVWIAAAHLDINYRQINFKRFSRDQIANNLNAHPVLKNIAASCFNKELIPSSELTWINDSQRQANFIENLLIGNLTQVNLTQYQEMHLEMPGISPASPVSPNGIPYELMGAERSIALIDYFLSFTSGGIQERVEITKKFLLAWEKQQEKDKEFDWFKKDDSQERIEFFWEWLKTKAPQLTYNRASFQNHDDLLSCFDFYYNDASSKTLLIQNFKKVWNQKQLRARSKGKKQRNYVLAEKTVSKLEKLAAKYHLTRTEIIELIINGEAEKETYIRERLSHKKLLLGSPEPTE